jgi:ligand-binding SRPBCC domain-containing protein
MTVINLKTHICAPIEKCFDLARDVDFHKLSTQKTNEEAIAGRLTGLCELNDEITWRAKHFGIIQKLSVKITAFEKPYFFEDKMTKGAFKSMRHEHHFVRLNENETEMIDKFLYEVPFGFLGRIVDKLILKNYMENFLLERNKMIQHVAEK